ncbi:dihydroneopterin aldolase [Rubellimicrobium aerolatum]|uniref:Dihydroneopterin aldolase n=1 Tax=Rubellimicrobium aerolatum TaxID=490979 RepID=A0ABW0SB43_9RHOB|nr:dihydroneopterin aldolase [Rubellimicrobium aerolatum]MBP1805429.1 dihydroneopterin aldolase [Rubellimicrobium aerolatum]
MPSDEIRQAFDHPFARSEATGSRPLDRISLRDHVVEAEIGAFEVERGVRQRLRFDIVVEVLPPHGAPDDVDRILSYDRLAEAVEAELIRERLALLETLAERVAARILSEPQAHRAFVRIQKLDRGPGDLGVEIVRSHEDAMFQKDDMKKAPRPRVVLLGARAAASPALARAMHILGGDGVPLVLVAPAAKAPRAATPEAQDRADLLAADQGAWLLAARHPELVVAANQTEVEWNLRQGHPVVWAPTKLALDKGWTGSDQLYRTIMFAWSLDALEVVLIGVPLDGLMEAPLRVRRATLRAPLESLPFRDGDAPE